MGSANKGDMQRETDGRAELAARLVQAMRTGDLARRTLTPGETASTTETAILRLIAKASDMENVRAYAAAELAKRFTEAELLDLIAFYESPLGIRLLDAQADMAADRSRVGRADVRAGMQQLIDKLRGDANDADTWQT